MVAPDASPEPIKIVVRTYILFNEGNGFVPCWLERKISRLLIAVLPQSICGRTGSKEKKHFLR
jgi:hypothetical protein